MTTIIVIAMQFTGPGAADESTSARLTAAPVSRGAANSPSRCPSARKALRYYTKRLRHWQHLLGAAERPLARGVGCPRYLVRVRRAKAFAAHREWNRWFRYHYAWSEWLPPKWQRIGACETGYGKRPGNWRHSNSSYEGAFGFAKQSWDSFKYRADPKAGPYPSDAWQATPRQQYEVALAIYRAYGFSGWGCRGA